MIDLLVLRKPELFALLQSMNTMREWTHNYFVYLKKKAQHCLMHVLN